MKQTTAETRRTGFQLMWHRRVGLTSFACLLLGTAWLSSVVLPGLQKSNEKQEAKLAGSGVSATNVLSFLTNKPKQEEIPSPEVATSPATPAIGTAEIALVNAPVGSALQLLLASARFSCSTDPAVTGVVSFSCVGSPKPFWEVLGRVIGASPAPGVHVAAVWDSYRVLPRDIKAMRMSNYSTAPVPDPSPVPMGDGRVTHRMAGYVSLIPNDTQPPVQFALMETRIPGLAPQWRMVRVGDSLQRKSSMDIARETDAAANIDTSVQVTEVSANRITLQGGGNKSLHIPLSEAGVTDIFGFVASTPTGEKRNDVDLGRVPRSAGGWDR